jgi:hypothetical protein
MAQQLAQPGSILDGVIVPDRVRAEVAPLRHSVFRVHMGEFGRPVWTVRGANWRRGVCHDSIIRFALCYFRPYLADQETGAIELCEAHLALAAIGQNWRVRGPHHDAFVGPRRLGKSTWRLIFVCWVLAYGYRQSVHLFGKTIPMSKGHLQRLERALKGEVPGMELLLADFPELALLPKAGEGRLRLAGGGWVTARSIDSTTLGEIGDFARSDVLIGDDLQKGAGKVSRGEVAETKEKLAGSILPMGANPAVLLLGTAFEPYDLGHDIVMRATGGRPRSDDQGRWLNRFRCHYYGPQSWPGRWSPEYLAARRAEGLKAYAQEFEPTLLVAAANETAVYWTEHTHREVYSFAVETDPREIGIRAASVISVDWAVGRGGRSDYTAIGVLTRSPSGRQACLEYAEQGHYDIPTIIERIRVLHAAAPADRKPTVLLWERNQGGENTADMVTLPGDMTMWASKGGKDQRPQRGYRVQARKADRIAALHKDADAGRLVLLRGGIGVELFKQQAEAWSPGDSGPGVDDLLDMVSGAVRYLLTGNPEM